MGWLSVRGRPPELPADRTPLRGARVDAAARGAWLLRTNRLASRYSATSDFLAAMAGRRVKLSKETLSRYETGAEPVSPELIMAYEGVLGLPSGHLLGVCEGMHGLFGPSLVDRPQRQWSRKAMADLWAYTEARIATRTITGMDWLTLAQALSSPTGLLPPSVLHDWCRVLVSQSMRSVGHANTTRMRALALFLADGHTRMTVFEEIKDATNQPGAQSVIDVLGALGTTTDRTVLRWLIQQLEREDGDRQVGVAKALLTSVVTGALPGDLVIELSRAILSAAHNRPEQGLVPFWLGQRMSPDLTREMVVALGRHPAPADPVARMHSPAHLSRYMHVASRYSGIHDVMLERLLREALSSDFIERRHHALLLLRFSPYRDILADTALDLLIEPDAVAAAGGMLTYLAGAGQRDRLLTASTGGAGGRPGEMLVALAHAGGVPDRVDLVARAGDPDQAADVVYAAGMSGHRDLVHIAESPRFAGTSVQTGARWWLRAGAAVTDLPAGHGTVDEAATAGVSPEPDPRSPMPGVTWSLPDPDVQGSGGH